MGDTPSPKGHGRYMASRCVTSARMRCAHAMDFELEVSCLCPDTSLHPPDSLTIGERKFECVQGHKSRRSQFSTTYSHHHPTRARIASNTPPTAPDHSPHTPDAPCTARFEPESRRTVGCGLNMTLAPTWPAGSASWPRHMLHNILISRSPGIRACATTRRAPTRRPPDRPSRGDFSPRVRSQPAGTE